MKKLLIVSTLWILLILSLIYWSYRQEMAFVEQLMHNEALTHLSRDKAFRYWASRHGGVYVPLTEELSPSPYLEHLPDRDIMTSEGKILTLMNPAWMLRQLMEEYEELYGVKGHITSLNPLREANSPDEWEKRALEQFERGAEEVSDFALIGDSLHYRLMKPLVTVERCLKCHEFQGYKAGDIRGGVSVSLSTEAYYRKPSDLLFRQAGILALPGILGLFIMGFACRIISGRSKKMNEAVMREKNSEELDLAREKMSSLHMFALRMAREINNPLTGIIQAAGVISSRFDRKIDSAESRRTASEEGIDADAVGRFLKRRGLEKMTGIISEEGHRIGELLKSLTDYNSIGTDGETSGNPGLYIQNALKLIEEFFISREYEAAHIEVILRIEQDLPEIKGDRLQPALFNIVLNSYENLLENGVDNPRILISARYDRGSSVLHISVKDNGTGLDAAQRKRAFEPFFTTRETVGAKGLGLSTAYFIVTRAYDGEIVILAEEDQGCEVRIRIPAVTSL